MVPVVQLVLVVEQLVQPAGQWMLVVEQLVRPAEQLVLVVEQLVRPSEQLVLVVEQLVLVVGPLSCARMVRRHYQFVGVCMRIENPAGLD